ncbi:MAG: hypothetical protein MUQ26_02045 [Armatimonadetes bacterium]|nr:hypothetical protein [Armatimonadota bacterium]
MRRIGYLALVLMTAYIILWLVGFINRSVRGYVEQRQVPDEGRAPAAAVRAA